MAYIKLDENRFALEADPNPTEVVYLDELQAEIDTLNAQIADIQANHVSTIGVTATQADAIEFYNQAFFSTENLEAERDEKQALYDQLSAL